jgi:hypothetical protein
MEGYAEGDGERVADAAVVRSQLHAINMSISASRCSTLEPDKRRECRAEGCQVRGGMVVMFMNVARETAVTRRGKTQRRFSLGRLRNRN